MEAAFERYMDRYPALDPRTGLFPTGVTVLRAIVVGRWLSWAWMVGIVALSDAASVRHPLLGWVAVGAALALTLTSTVLVRARPQRLIRAPFVLAEVGLSLGLSIVDGFVFEPGHVFAASQSIATQWPLLAAATAGVAYGPVLAGAFGALFGPAEWLGALANEFDRFSTRHVVSLCATSLFYAACGALFGWQSRLLKQAEGEIADRRARDELARVLHDTVLQTLALVETRTASTDPELAAAARQADVDLRAFLFGAVSRNADDLSTAIRAAVERARHGHDVPVTVSVIDDGCRLNREHREMLARAVGEAVANAIEHAHAERIVVFAETDDRGQVFASVNDNGIGFDSDAHRDTHGIDESIIGRIKAIGGRVEIRSGQSGTEVCMWTSPASR
jgi:signal transduction histidine kinase